jgi:hypothetical protein
MTLPSERRNVPFRGLWGTDWQQPNEMLSHRQAKEREKKQPSLEVAMGKSASGSSYGGAIAQTITVRRSYLLLAAGVGLSVLVGRLPPLRERRTVAELTGQEL